MFPDPYEMFNDYFEKLRESQQRDDYIDTQIDEHKGYAIKKIYKYCDPFIAEAIAATIACAYMNELPQAIDIVDKMRLNDKHMAALNNDKERMWDLIKQDFNDSNEMERCYGE